MTDRPRCLRACLASDEVSQWRFGQARDLSAFLFTREPNRMLMPFYTDHTEAHCEKVEGIIDQILFGPPGEQRQLDNRAFIPTAEEAAYLLSAIWLHDIGMIYGIFPEEENSVPDGDEWRQYRDRHELRSVRYILERWRLNSSHWESHEKVLLAEICLRHRQRHALEGMSPAQTTGRDGKPVRLRELAALLRLGDACHVDSTRTPVDLRNVFRSVGMPAESQMHWGVLSNIHEVRFNSAAHRIEPHCHIPRKRAYGLATVDFQLAVDWLVRGIRKELDTVIPYLATYSNTEYATVEAVVARPGALAEEVDKYLREIWPCMLMTTSSASEVSCMLAAVLLAFVGGQSRLVRHELETVLEQARKLHPYNFLVRRMRDRLYEFLGAQSPPAEVVQYLKRHLVDRVDACDSVADAARAHIDEQDILVVYGYSHEIMTLLTERLRGHQGMVLVVNCRRNDPDLRIEGENERIIEELLKAKTKCKVVELASLRGIFEYFKKAERRVKVLIGVRGVFNGGDVLSTVGNATIAATAKASGVDVLVLADPDKELPGGAIRDEIEDVLLAHAAQSLGTHGGPHATQGEVTEIVPIDRLTPEMYDHLIGLAGAATPGGEADG